MTLGRGPELKAFLRKMRARLAPEDVGLPAAGRRRRTPGLRVEEAAALAGVSLTWYSALESGKGGRVSANLLDRIGTALRLNSQEREHLAALAGAPHGASGSIEIDPILQSVVDGFSTGPAFVSDRFWNVRAYNALADAVYGISGSVEQNLLVRMLSEAELRDLHEDWTRIARQMVDVAHLSFGHTPEDAEAHALIKRLRASSAEFTEWWNDYGLRRFVPTNAILYHPTMGRLAFTYTSFVATASHRGDEHFVIVLQPAADAETIERIDAWRSRLERDGSMRA